MSSVFDTDRGSGVILHVNRTTGLVYTNRYTYGIFWTSLR